MFKILIHRWRLLVEPSGKGRLQGFGPERWRVRYAPCTENPEGGVSHALAYDVACDYAEMWGGTVVRVTPNSGMSGALRASAR